MFSVVVVDDANAVMVKQFGQSDPFDPAVQLAKFLLLINQSKSVETIDECLRVSGGNLVQFPITFSLCELVGRARLDE